MMLKGFQWTSAILFFALILCRTADAKTPDPQNKLIALKKGDLIYARSYFSPEKDILIIMNKGLNGQVNFSNTRLISEAAPSDDALFRTGVLFHDCPDDAAPWNLNDTYIGANHGCSNGREITVKKHCLTVADIGSEWTDNVGNKFYIIKLAGPDNIWLLSKNRGNGGIWNFNVFIKGDELKNPVSGKVLKIEGNKMLQIRPALRIKEQKYLADGRNPLQESVPTPCEFLDLEEEYDIICPDSLLQMIQRNTGKEPDFVAQSLDSVMTVHTLYRFMPLAACTVEHRVKVNKKFNIGHALFVMTGALYIGSSYDKREYYIPKTLPFEKNGYKYDFRSVQDFSIKLPFPIYFSEKEKNIESPDNYPDRFMQFLCKTEDGRTIRDVGFVIGYSLIEGLSRAEERVKTVSNPIWINNTTSKTYPFAIDGKIGTSIAAGSEFHCLVYRQYFNPSAFSSATSVYWHKEAGAYMLYVDYHKSVEKDVIKLPDYLSGKKITIIEKTPSVKLFTDQTVPLEGIVLSVSDQYGYAILKLEE